MKCLYPEWLEHWWLQQAEQHFGAQNSSSLEYLKPLVPVVQQLSNLFTTERPSQFKDYVDSQKSALAYGLFFFPQSFVRILYPLVELLNYWQWKPYSSSLTTSSISNLDSLKILDLGCGLGAAGLGVSYLLNKYYPNLPIHLQAIDHSTQSLTHLKDLAIANKDLLQNLTLETSQLNVLQYPTLKNASSSSFDLIVLGWAFNEITHDFSFEEKINWIQKLLNKLSLNGILLILEPALRTTSENLQKLSDTLIASKACHRWGPYLHQGPCPLLQNEKFWNHEVRTWSPPDSKSYLNRTLFRSSESELKFAYTALSKAAPPLYESSKTHIRMISPLSLMKGEFLFSGVASDGQAYRYHLPTRGLSKRECKNIQKQFERGDILKLKDLIPTKDLRAFKIESSQSIIEHFHATPLLQSIFNIY